MIKSINAAPFGAAILGWIVLVVISGGSLTSCIFLLAALFWGVPWVWGQIVSKTLESGVDRTLIILAVVFVVLAVYSIL